MLKQSAGILMYRINGLDYEVLLVHPGGPYWSKKDTGTWSIPKGEFGESEDPFFAAKREFKEETGMTVVGEFDRFQPVKQKNGKIIHVWAVKGDIDPKQIKSNVFELEWPPKSGERQEFPEIDKASWFTLPEARQKINQRQVALIDELFNKYCTKI
ncbi:NUDIX domain-containing protein [Solitalea lacus]|uniref:NUDIX domain-containing protein n=1 Tax=Solitalea lacus TaxID=2911172 RepID=UPI001EDAF9F5|nr:NUDIX domain-containing protein [Solitalea lacus]UKJ06695.1 NUDIX domain-containing protein [Solitalea lacus]